MSSANASQLLQAHLDRLLASREPPKTICPSEVARSLSAQELADLAVSDWRELMNPTRALVWQMRSEGAVEICQGGQVLGDDVAMADVRGPIRPGLHDVRAARSTTMELREFLHGLTVELAVIFVIFALAVPTTMLRLYSRLALLRRWGLDDILVLIGMLIGIVLIGIGHSMTTNMRAFGRRYFAEGRPFPYPPDARTPYTDIFKFEFVLTVLYPLEIGLLKVSILAFYARFLPPKPYLPILWFIAVLTALFCLATSMATLFQCSPVSKAWDVDVTCAVNVPVLHLVISLFNLLTDLAILILPIQVTARLRTTRKRKVGLVALFSIGLLGTIVTAVRLAKLFDLANIEVATAVIPFLATTHSVVMWSQVELNIVLLCVNLPALAALWKHGIHLTRAPPQYQSYKLEDTPKGSRHMTTALASAHHPAASQEQMMHNTNEIVRSTTVIVDVEDVEKLQVAATAAAVAGPALDRKPAFM
ncbi:MAG: hypothetical protein M1826_000136 [Phylliscum demangeonii]|nr:MAG: hypothetical protein M1826_000136 [Phylliscum demangeonii]